MGGTDELQAAITAYFDLRLAPQGIARRRDDDNYWWPIAEGFDGWLSLGLNGRRTWVSALPYVGVRSAEVEAMVPRLGGDGRRGRTGGTFSRPLDSIITEPGWSVTLRDFSADEPIGSYADWIADCFLRWGRPWVEEHASLAALRPEGVSFMTLPGSPFVDVRRLAVLVLCGDAAGARGYLAKVQEEARLPRFDPQGKHAALVARWSSQLETLL